MILPKLRLIADAHIAGTRFGIHVDPEDGLLAQGEEGYQLTWMDAKVGDWVVTPRRGKAVEINALWYNALCLLSKWGRERRGSQRGFHLPQLRYPRPRVLQSTLLEPADGLFIRCGGWGIRRK